MAVVPVRHLLRGRNWLIPAQWLGNFIPWQLLALLMLQMRQLLPVLWVLPILTVHRLPTIEAIALVTYIALP